MTTNTPDTTRLTDEQVQESLSWLSRAQQAESHTVAVALWANTYGHQLHAHITTLAAELVRVEGERDRLREALVEVRNEACHCCASSRISRAALNGDASATPPSSHCDTCGEEIATGAQWETFEPGDGSGVYVRCAACMPEEPADAE